jgi:hypothetical protein
VCVFDGCNQLPRTDVVDLLVRLSASVQKRLETLSDVVNVQVPDGSRHPLVAVRIQTYFLGPHFEANIVSTVDIGLDTQQPDIERLGAGEVLEGIDERSDAVIHGKLLWTCHIRPVFFVTAVTYPNEVM